MPTAVLTEEEKARIRYHGGYLLTSVASAIILGIPAARQPAFLVEQAMEHIPDTAIAIIRNLVAKCDITEDNIMQAQTRMVAKSVDEIDLNHDEADQLRGEYRYWVQKLYDNLGCPINAYASAFQSGGRPPINIPVFN
jgi:hypothetical protein